MRKAIAAVLVGATLLLGACTIPVDDGHGGTTQVGVGTSDEAACTKLGEAVELRPDSPKWNRLVNQAFFLSESAAFEDALSNAYWTLNGTSGEKAERAYARFC